MKIHFSVTINIGKRTPLSILVVPTSVKGKAITLSNGSIVSESDLADVIDDSIRLCLYRAVNPRRAKPAAAPDLLAACETLWSELKNKLASIDVHPGFRFAEDSPCIVYFLDRIVQCSTMTEGIAKCDGLMAEEFPDVYAAIAAAKGSPQ